MAKIRIPREEGESHFETISDLWQPAKFFERDIHEMFGVYFDGSQDMEKYILTDWNGPPPMRKDFITREFALNFYHFREYEPQWLKDMAAAEEKMEVQEKLEAQAGRLRIIIDEIKEVETNAELQAIYTQF